MTWILPIISVILISLISLIGVFTLSLKQEGLKKLSLFLISFAVGALFGDSFIHLIPEAFEKIPNSLFVSILIILGIFIFFVLEKFLRWKHCHDLDCKEHMRPVATMNLVGDMVHNLIDGALVAASFQIGIPLGMATTLAVVLHEIPQEIGDLAF